MAETADHHEYHHAKKRCIHIGAHHEKSTCGKGNQTADNHQVIGHPVREFSGESEHAHQHYPGWNENEACLCSGKPLDRLYEHRDCVADAEVSCAEHHTDGHCGRELRIREER